MKFQNAWSVLILGIALTGCSSTVKADTVVVRQPGLVESVGQMAVGTVACTAEMCKGLVCGSTTVVQTPNVVVAPTAVATPVTTVATPAVVAPAPVVVAPQVVYPAVPLMPYGSYYTPYYHHYYRPYCRPYYHHYYRPYCW